jgi:hypothetical protein
MVSRLDLENSEIRGNVPQAERGRHTFCTMDVGGLVGASAALLDRP